MRSLAAGRREELVVGERAEVRVGITRRVHRDVANARDDRLSRTRRYSLGRSAATMLAARIVLPTSVSVPLTKQARGNGASLGAAAATQAAWPIIAVVGADGASPRKLTPIWCAAAAIASAPRRKSLAVCEAMTVRRSRERSSATLGAGSPGRTLLAQARRR